MHSNPILQNLKNFYTFILFGLILSIISFLILIIQFNLSYKAALADSLISSAILCGLTLAWYYPVTYISIERNKLHKVLLSHIISAIISALLWLFLIYLILINIIDFGAEYASFFYKASIWRILGGVIFYALAASFYYIVVYYTGFQERIIKESELKNLVTVAELKSLKFQINPHFIFNSLNSISALTEIDPKKAKEMIIKLADFLRYILATNEREKNKLSEELKNIRLYLAIEKIRFEDKFDYSEEINEECNKVEIPNMILQPLFENVIKHAVYETLDKVHLTLKCSIDDGYLKIHLQNDFDESSKPRKGAGVGLKNIQERLNLIYRRNDLMEVKKEKCIFSVTLFIPIDNKLRDN